MWKELVKETEKEYFVEILKNVESLRKTKTIYPPREYMFEAFKLTSFKDVKVVIIGQDPYHGANQAHGLAFSTLDTKIPKSLKNIYKELSDDVGISIPKTGNLTPWAKQGVFLINTILTVEEKKPQSHKHLNWQIFTNYVIKYINDNKDYVVFVLWGNDAKKMESLIDSNKHTVLTSSHPSPLSAYVSFFKSKVFSKINNDLIKHNIKPINWEIK